MMNNRINERRVSKGEHKIDVEDIEDLFEVLGIDNYGIDDRDKKDGHVTVSFTTDGKHHLILELRLQDPDYDWTDDWPTYDLWFEGEYGKQPEWRGCSIQELREDLEDLLSYLD